MGVPSYLIDDASALDPEWLADVDSIGVTAGASAPEDLVQELIARLRDFGELRLEVLDGIKENVYFKLPEQLREIAV
jgi:4-hydroxy-3-methylbut-2-enyl diphosphate reductase